MPPRDRVPQLLTHLDRPGTVGRRDELVQRFGRITLEHALAQGLVTRLAPGLFAHAAHAREFATLVRAAHQWMPADAVIGGVSALALHGAAPEPIAITVVATRPCHPRRPVFVRLKRHTGPVWGTHRSGMRVAAVNDALVQAWAEWAPAQRTGRLLDALRISESRGDQVAARLVAYPRLPQRALLERVLGRACDGVQSYLEYLADVHVLTGEDLRAIARQVAIDVDGQRFIIDAFDHASRTAIEFDGAAFHGDDQRRRRDIARDAALASVGIQTIRFTYEDVAQRASWVRACIRETLAARAGGARVSLSR